MSDNLFGVVLDGKDSQFIDQSGHDKSGRFVPYWYRDGTNTKLEPLIEYDIEGAGDYYLLAKNSGYETILEPYLYSVGGRKTLLTSLVVPIKVNSKTIAVAGIDMGLDTFQKIVKEVRPFGGYSEIISNSGIYTAGLKKSLIGERISDSKLKNAIKSEEIFSRVKYSDLLKTDVYEVFVPIKIGESKTPWSFGVVLPLENVLAEVNEFKILTIVISIISIMLILLVLFFVVSKIVKPLATLELRAENLATGDGDLTKKLELNGDDEIAKASISINNFIEKVRETISNIKVTSNETASIANQLSATAKEIGKRVEEEAYIIEESVVDGEKDRDLLDTSLQKSKNTKEDIEKSNINLEEAKVEILKMTSQVQKSSKVEDELSQKLTQLSENADQVKGVLTVIADIADQTNLLALNAAIEAARAGEHGRGFAVVADEVRQLAERTQKSLVEINSTINIIVQSIVDTSEQMNINSKDIQNLAQISSDVESRINSTTDLMSKTLETANQSLQNTTEVVNHYEARIKKIESISEFSNSNARALEETITATKHLYKMTGELNSKLNEFKT